MTEADIVATVATLFEIWHPSLLRYALRVPLRYEIAEDLVRETFLQLYLTLRAGRHIEHPKAWTLCILKRSIHSTLEQEFRYEPFEQLEQISAIQHNLVDSIALRDLLSRLSERERRVILLRLDGFKYREIADQL